MKNKPSEQDFYKESSEEAEKAYPFLELITLVFITFLIVGGGYLIFITWPQKDSEDHSIQVDVPDTASHQFEFNNYSPLWPDQTEKMATDENHLSNMLVTKERVVTVAGRLLQNGDAKNAIDLLNYYEDTTPLAKALQKQVLGKNRKAIDTIVEKEIGLFAQHWQSINDSEKIQLLTGDKNTKLNDINNWLNDLGDKNLYSFFRQLPHIYIPVIYKRISDEVKKVNPRAKALLSLMVADYSFLTVLSKELKSSRYEDSLTEFVRVFDLMHGKPATENWIKKFRLNAENLIAGADTLNWLNMVTGELLSSSFSEKNWENLPEAIRKGWGASIYKIFYEDTQFELSQAELALSKYFFSAEDKTIARGIARQVKLAPQWKAHLHQFDYVRAKESVSALMSDLQLEIFNEQVSRYLGGKIKVEEQIFRFRMPWRVLQNVLEVEIERPANLSQNPNDPTLSDFDVNWKSVPDWLLYKVLKGLSVDGKKSFRPMLRQAAKIYAENRMLDE